MRVNLTDSFALERDRYQYILIHKLPSNGKNGDIKTVEKKTYHGSIEQVANKICNITLETQAPRDIKDLIFCFNTSVDILITAIEGKI